MPTLTRTYSPKHLDETDSKEFCCEECILGKQTLQISRKLSEKTTETLQLIHIDTNGLWGSLSLPKSTAGRIRPISGGSVHFLLFIDNYSSRVWEYFYTTKDQYLGCLKHFINLVQTQTGRKIKRIQGDGAKEFDLHGAKKAMETNGTRFEASAPYAHGQNGKAERMNRTLIEMGRIYMIQAGLPEEFWAEAIRTAASIRNRVPTTAPRDKWTRPSESIQPSESIRTRIPLNSFGENSNLIQSRPFGCAAYITVPHAKCTKHLSQERAQRGILWAMKARTSIGYEILSQGGCSCKRRNVRREKVPGEKYEYRGRLW
jgi:hypothetical protein